ncbi:hypothetical protein A4X09_0g7267 [Tilletia walkeri]|uniref:Protein kinase domain-containing protein n=1 Tax=Tilletia walkeri TaxID=117179 RepID=A0A8X7N142_9BASI|nr:hypothetical protein A4X09_0g7267 [Tilletia walkeri]
MVETRSRTSRATLANGGGRAAGSAAGKAASSTTTTTTTTTTSAATTHANPSSHAKTGSASSVSKAAGSTSGTGSSTRRIGVASNTANASSASSGLNPSRYSARSSTTSTRQSTLANNPVPPQMTSNGSSRPSSRANIPSYPHHHQQQQQSYRESQSSARLSTSHAATPVAGGSTSSGTAAGAAQAPTLNHPYNTRKNNAVHTVNELIAGKIQQVYVLEDDEEGKGNGEEGDRPSSQSTPLASQSNGANASGYAAHHLQQHPYHPHQSNSGLPPPARPLTSDYPLHYTSARGQPAGVSVTGAYRPSPRLNGSVLRGASTASGRGSVIPQHHHYSSSSNLAPPQSTAGAGKGKRKARDELSSSQYYSNNPNATGGAPSHYAHPAPHLLSMQGQSHVNASSPALSTTSSNRYASQSVGVSAPAPHGALDRAMQAQHRAAAAAAVAAAASAGGDGSHYLSQHDLGAASQGSSAAASGGTGVAVPSKRRRRDAEGNYASGGHPHHLQHPVGSSAKTSSAAAAAADYSIISTRHAAGGGGAGSSAGYYASPSATGAVVYPPAAISAGATAPASYRGGYPAGQGYVETQYAGDVSNSGAVVGQAVPAEELPCDDKEGHYIVRPGEYVGARYRIIGLLGQGTFGKVVECIDVRSRTRVAVKVIRAIQKYRDASQIEIRVLKTLKDHDPTNKHQCIHLIEHFTFRNHVCIVSELLGKSVFDFLKENDFAPFPSMHIWSFAKQLLKSVSFLHRLGLVHTDLKPENILLVSADNTPVRTNAATGGGSARRHPKVRNMLRSTEIRLIDFGSATFDHEYHSAVVSTRHYRAPEIILGMGWSFPCDAWSIGCILVEFYTGDALFQTHDNLEHLAMMEAVLGVMPDDYRRQAESYKPELFRHGRLNFPNADVPKQSKRYVRQMKKLQDIIGGGAGGVGGGSASASAANATYAKHNTRFVHLIRRLLEFDPQRRITVSDALNHPYFDLVEHEFPP